jgi:hypothetical protein
MMEAIKLTKAKADSVRGDYPQNHCLAPFKIGSYWYLPVAVLDNPAYAEAFDVLNTCPIVTVEYPQGDEE